MDAGGFNWLMMTGIGAVILFAVILFATIRNRSSRVDRETTEIATHRLYQEEDAAHRGEDNRVP